MTTVSMTWPEYRRRECRYNGLLISLSQQQADVLLTLLVRGPLSSDLKLLSDVLWGNDPDGGPEHVTSRITQIMRKLRGKLPGVIQSRYSFGWRIEPTAG